MATVRFILSSKGDRPEITARLRINDNRKVQTRLRGVLAFRQWWSNAKQTHITKYVNPIFLPEVNQVNKTLSSIATYILARFAETPADEITKEWLDEEIERMLHPDKYKKKEEERSVMQLLDDFIASAPTRIQPRKGRPISEKTLLHYKQTRHYLHSYMLKNRVKELKKQELNKSFYDSFVSFLYAEGLRPNTVGNHIKHLKAVINALPIEERIGVEFIERGKCAKITEEVENVYLNEDELAILQSHKLSSERLERVRDEFILLAWTGCRYSDLGKLNKENIVTMQGGYQYFKLVQKKTEAKVTIPILPAAKTVLEKYGYVMPKPMSNQKFNEYIKDACKEAGIDDDVTITRNEAVKGKLKMVTRHLKKWECVTAHTARRSFATNMYKRDFPTLMIMAITGHKTEKAFLTYIKVTEDENAERMMAKFMEQEYGQKSENAK